MAAVYNRKEEILIPKPYTKLMRGSAIIFGSTQKARESKVLELLEAEVGQKLNTNYLGNFPDFFVVTPLEDKKSIGIAQAKEGTAFLAERPLSLELKVLIIYKAETLTVEAQNSLLKTLEEPPSYALILLVSKTENVLLPTVLSRCKKIKVMPALGVKSELKNEWTLKYVLGLGFGERLDWVEEFSKEERNTIIGILEEWVESARELLIIASPEVGSFEFSGFGTHSVESILEVIDDFENTNVGARLTLENLVLSI